LAQNSGAAEIGIDHLLVALDRPLPMEEEMPSLFEQMPEICGAVFYNTDWIPLSNGLTAAIGSIGGLEAITNVDAFRNALIDARKHGKR
jgi:hypothetical protein